MSSGGTVDWKELNTSSITVPDLGFGDFNGDGKTDVFRANGQNWYVSYNGTSKWQVINTAREMLPTLGFADFNGDGKTDVFRSFAGSWQVSYAGATNWQTLAPVSVRLFDLAFGDFDGDGKADVLVHSSTLRASDLALFSTSQQHTVPPVVLPSHEITHAEAERSDGALNLAPPARPRRR